MSIHTLLALSGSLRQRSYNTSAITALKALAPEGVKIILGEIKDLPLFNPDLENTFIPSVAELKANVNLASGLIIASPEYAHGISGPMKNALDWLVSGMEFPGKPIMIINTSPRASHALTALKEVLLTMSGLIVDEAYVSIPLLGSGLTHEGILNNRELSGLLLSGLMSFIRKIELRDGK